MTDSKEKEMKLECDKHSMMFSFYCPRSGCRLALCEKCAKDHEEHGVLNTAAFADYAAREIRRRETEISASLAEAQIFDASLGQAYLQCAKKTVESTHRLIDAIKAAVEFASTKVRDLLSASIQNVGQAKKRVAEGAEELSAEHDRLHELHDYVVNGKANDHFLAIQQAWEQFQSEAFHAFSVDEVNTELISEFTELIAKVQAGAIELASRCDSVKEELAKSAEQLITATSLSEGVKSKPDRCWSCMREKDIYLIQACGHGLCWDCAQKEIELKIGSKGVKVIDNELECMACGYDAGPVNIVHPECGCMINVRRLRAHCTEPYVWDRENQRIFMPYNRESRVPVAAMRPREAADPGGRLLHLGECGVHLLRLIPDARANGGGGGELPAVHVHGDV